MHNTCFQVSIIKLKNNNKIKLIILTSNYENLFRNIDAVWFSLDYFSCVKSQIKINQVRWFWKEKNQTKLMTIKFYIIFNFMLYLVWFLTLRNQHGATTNPTLLSQSHVPPPWCRIVYERVKNVMVFINVWICIYLIEIAIHWFN